MWRGKRATVVDTALPCKKDEMFSIGLLLFVWGSWFFICGLLVKGPLERWYAREVSVGHPFRQMIALSPLFLAVGVAVLFGSFLSH